MNEHVAHLHEIKQTLRRRSQRTSSTIAQISQRECIPYEYFMQEIIFNLFYSFDIIETKWLLILSYSASLPHLESNEMHMRTSDTMNYRKTNDFIHGAEKCSFRLLFPTQINSLQEQNMMHKKEKKMFDLIELYSFFLVWHPSVCC